VAWLHPSFFCQKKYFFTLKTYYYLPEVRKPFIDKILSYLETNENLTPYVTDLLEDQNMLQLLIDCTKFVASFTLTAAIVTANGSVPQLDQILWQCPYLASDKCRNFSELLFILQCASLQEVRKPLMDKVLSYLETNENLTPYVTDLLEDQNML
jgi:DNA-binding protein Fis